MREGRSREREKNVSRVKQPAGRKVLFGGKKWNVTRRCFSRWTIPRFLSFYARCLISSRGHRNFSLPFPRRSSFPASLIPSFLLSVSLFLALQFLYHSRSFDPPSPTFRARTGSRRDVIVSTRRRPMSLVPRCTKAKVSLSLSLDTSSTYVFYLGALCCYRLRYETRRGKGFSRRRENFPVDASFGTRFNLQ